MSHGGESGGRAFWVEGAAAAKALRQKGLREGTDDRVRPVEQGVVLGGPDHKARSLCPCTRPGPEVHMPPEQGPSSSVAWAKQALGCQDGAGGDSYTEGGCSCPEHRDHAGLGPWGPGGWGSVGRSVEAVSSATEAPCEQAQRPIESPSSPWPQPHGPARARRPGLCPGMCSILGEGARAPQSPFLLGPGKGADPPG